jgi:hypothetical protein
VVASIGWQGEYPAPPVWVPVDTPLPARTDPCAPDTDRTCTVPAGLYHPWAADGPAAGFITVRPSEPFEAARDLALDGDPVAAGTRVAVVFYAGEGFCQFAWGDQTAFDSCPGMAEDDGWLALPVAEHPEQQLFTARCLESPDQPAHVDVLDALASEGVVEAWILGWGEVGPPD